jgi:hypothetical protein
MGVPATRADDLPRLPTSLRGRWPPGPSLIELTFEHAGVGERHRRRWSPRGGPFRQAL